MLAWLILKVTSTQGFLPDRVVYNVSFNRIQGLAEGAEVRYEGVTVGKVESIDFAENPNVNRINVRLSVRRSMSARIDKEVVAELHAVAIDVDVAFVAVALAFDAECAAQSCPEDVVAGRVT